MGRAAKAKALTVVEAPPELLKLDFGCGPHKREGFLGVDARQFVVSSGHSLSRYPFSLSASSLSTCLSTEITMMSDGRMSGSIRTTVGPLKAEARVSSTVRCSIALRAPDNGEPVNEGEQCHWLSISVASWVYACSSRASVFRWKVFDLTSQMQK